MSSPLTIDTHALNEGQYLCPVNIQHNLSIVNSKGVRSGWAPAAESQGAMSQEPQRDEQGTFESAQGSHCEAPR